jgi:hypothetical protein
VFALIARLGFFELLLASSRKWIQHGRGLDLRNHDDAPLWIALAHGKIFAPAYPGSGTPLYVCPSGAGQDWRPALAINRGIDVAESVHRQQSRTMPRSTTMPVHSTTTLNAPSSDLVLRSGRGAYFVLKDLLYSALNTLWSASESIVSDGTMAQGSEESALHDFTSLRNTEHGTVVQVRDKGRTLAVLSQLLIWAPIAFSTNSFHISMCNILIDML